MKLLHCPNCADAVSIGGVVRACSCGRARAVSFGGRVIWNGHGIVFGVHDSALAAAARRVVDGAERDNTFMGFIVRTDGRGLTIDESI